MASRTLFRGLTTSARACQSISTTSAASLGFTEQARTRQLPNLGEMTATARKNIDFGEKRKPRPRDSRAGKAVPRRPSGTAPAAASEADFFGSAGAEADTPITKTLADTAIARMEGRRRRQPRVAETDVGAAVSAPDGARPKRKARVERRPRDATATQLATVPVPRARPSAPGKVDHSPLGLFGGNSLLMPAARGARDAEASYWAEGMEAGAARKAEILRLAGQYTTLLPTLAASTAPADRAKSSAAWTLAMNRSVGLRRAGTAGDAVKAYLG
ncbi:hypothetical protein Q5752_002533 [Cryptotrichosporon argae]